MKSKDPQGNFKSPQQDAKRNVSLNAEERSREARRASNRLSQKNSRLKQKKIIKDLKDSNSSLRTDNTHLRLQLKEALLQNQQLRNLMGGEHKVAMEQNRALQRHLEKRLKQDKSPSATQGLSSTHCRVTPPYASVQSSLGNIPSLCSTTSHSALRNALDLSHNQVGKATPNSSSNNSMLPSHPSVTERGQDVSTSPALTEAMASEIRSLEQELKELREKVSQL